jgi:heme exporter protein D
MWNSVEDFFLMGGYGFYVWSSFGVCALFFILEPLLIKLQHRAIIERLRREVKAKKYDEGQE